MDFQIHGLALDQFRHLFAMSNDDLAKHHILRSTVTESNGTPCRVSLQDAALGETVLLFNYEHQSENTPFRSSYAIYVRENAEPIQLTANEVPELLRRRLLSVRAFGYNHMLRKADVVPGSDVEVLIEAFLDDPEIAYLHLHNAREGCYHAKVTRPAKSIATQ